MANAWEGDWEQRIVDFARAQGHETMWSYLLANPVISFGEVAERIGTAAPIQVYMVAATGCIAARAFDALVCDTFARVINKDIPGGWGSISDARQIGSDTYLLALPQPYQKLRPHILDYLLDIAPPSLGWLPKSGNDHHLRAAFAYAVTKLPDEKRQIIEMGEYEREPGQVYLAAIKPIGKLINIYEGPKSFLEQFSAVKRELGHLFASHWCQSEVCNGGFHQFYMNPSGVLAPEAAIGFEAIGLPQCGRIVRESMAYFGKDYPREQKRRQKMLTPLFGRRRKDHFGDLDSAFYGLLDREGSGFSKAADEYAQRLESTN